MANPVAAIVTVYALTLNLCGCYDDVKLAAKDNNMIKDFDHVVLTTADLDQCLDFYTRVLGMRVERYGARGAQRIALRFGDRKFNVHPPGFNASLKADKPTPGSLDFCFLADRPLGEV